MCNDVEDRPAVIGRETGEDGPADEGWMCGETWAYWTRRCDAFSTLSDWKSANGDGRAADILMLDRLDLIDVDLPSGSSGAMKVGVLRDLDRPMQFCTELRLGGSVPWFFKPSCCDKARGRREG